MFTEIRRQINNNRPKCSYGKQQLLVMKRILNASLKLKTGHILFIVL